MRPYKVLCTANSPEWLGLRHARVTATEAYSLLLDERAPGKKWPKTRSELVLEKAGPVPPSWDDTRRMWHGRYNEDHNRRKFSDITGIRSRGSRIPGPTSKSTNVFLESTELPELACTLDGVLIAPQRQREAITVATSRPWAQQLQDTLHLRGGFGILEMKQTDDFFGKEWKTGVPEHYKHQVWAPLVVTGFEYAVIACQIGAADMEAHVIEHPGKAHVDTLREELVGFWEQVREARNG